MVDDIDVKQTFALVGDPDVLVFLNEEPGWLGHGIEDLEPPASEPSADHIHLFTPYARWVFESWLRARGQTDADP